MTDQPTGNRKLQGAIGGASAAAMLVAVMASFEGRRDDPYQDLIGKWTVCYGETNVAMRHYSPAECKDMLAGSLTQYVVEVRKVNPDLAGPQLVAATSLEYNIGVGAYRRSSVARLFNAHRDRDACNAFVRYSFAGGHQVPGLLRRREDERRICLTGVQ